MDQRQQSERKTATALPAPVGVPLVSEDASHATWPISAADKAPAAGQQPTSASHGRFSDEVHTYLREYIRNADQKATFFFATLTALLAFLNAQNVSARWLKDIRLWSFVDALGFLSMFGLAAGAATLLAVIFPRLKGSRRGIFFFDAIAECDGPGEYANDVLSHSGDHLVRTKLQHCYELSKICSTKYRVLRVGFWIGCVGAGSALLFLVLAKSVSP